MLRGIAPAIRLDDHHCAIREFERCPDCAPVPLFGDASSALLWLRRGRVNRSMLNSLRYALVDLGIAVDLLDDEDVLARFAWLLAAGRFHICYEKMPEFERGLAASEEDTRPVPAEFRRTATAGAAALQPEFGTLPDDVDAAALAATQKQAAALGVPFCEECVKKALGG